VAGTRARRVLVVDDLRDSADSLAMLLRQGGHDVRVAYDGEEALACAAVFQPEAAFIDVGMPRMDGHALARRLRETERGRGALLVAVTGWGGDDDRARARDAGFDAHLTKPVAGEALNEVLARLGG
jgi:CheY-like chemotaxis protein